MNLSVTLKGQTHDLTLKNPVLTASGTFGYGLEFASYGDLASLGGLVTKGLSLMPRPGNPTPRIVETTAGMLNAVGLQNDGVEDFCARKLPLLPWQETAVIANIYAATVEEFGQLAARLNAEEGVAALEVNVSCPNVRQGGIAFGQDPGMAAQVTEAVRKAAPDKHIMVKLSPNVTDLALMARSVEAAGADSISCINTLLGMAVDLQVRKPRLANVVGFPVRPSSPWLCAACGRPRGRCAFQWWGWAAFSPPRTLWNFCWWARRPCRWARATFCGPTAPLPWPRICPAPARAWASTTWPPFAAALSWTARHGALHPTCAFGA